MTIAIYFNEMPMQQNARDNSKRQDSSSDQNGETATITKEKRNLIRRLRN